MPSLSRLLNPKSIAVIGGAWGVNVIEQLQKSGYKGEIWPVHPSRKTISGIACFSDLAALPAAPDAAFIGVNNQITISVIGQLSEMKAGGAICFASGFEEAGNDALQGALLTAARDMPFLGPNCYGLLNYLDNVTLWPDQHGGQHGAHGKPCSRGVGIIAQSSNIAINMSMQKRGVPIGQIITIGNQAQTGLAELIDAQIDDPRISAIGLYLEGFGDIAKLEAAAHRARKSGKPIIAIKAGLSEKSQIAVMSHTASLSGSAQAAQALLARLGIVQVSSVAEFMETLKLLHDIGPLSGSRISSVSCSGGEASLMADLAQDLDLNFPDFETDVLAGLGAALGDDVILANPLDYHTYIWGDVLRMQACFSAVMQSGHDLNVFVLDMPRADMCDPSSYDCAVQAIIGAKAETGANVAVLSLLPENLDEAVIARFSRGGVTVLNGMETGLKAIAAAAQAGAQARAYLSRPSSRSRPNPKPVWINPRNSNDGGIILSEHEAKTALDKFGLNIPKGRFYAHLNDIKNDADLPAFPLVLKAMGIAHKTEAGGVILNINTAQDLSAACKNIAKTQHGYLLEPMQPKPVAELIIGASRDATGLWILTLGAGGILAELLQDSVATALPCTKADIARALESLKIYKILRGYRGQPAANLPAIIDAAMAICDYVGKNRDTLIELDINPLMANTDSALAVDALIRLQTPNP